MFSVALIKITRYSEKCKFAGENIKVSDSIRASSTVCLSKKYFVFVYNLSSGSEANSDISQDEYIPENISEPSSEDRSSFYTKTAQKFLPFNLKIRKRF